MCEVCEVLKEQLNYERDRNKELLETLTSLLKPQTIITSAAEPKPITPKAVRWSRRRAELEKLDAETARINHTSPVIGSPDKIEDLEAELDIQSERSEEVQ